MENNIINTQTYAGVDILKFAIAFLPVAQHSLFEQSFITVEDHTLAVPYFFIVSGFLLGKKMERIQSLDDRKKELLRRALILFKLFGKWLLIYLPLAVYFYWISNPTPFLEAVGNYVWHAVIRGDTAYGWHLWFIYSMAILQLVYMFLLYRHRHSCLMLFLFFAALHLIYYLCVHDISNERILYLMRVIIKKQLGGGLYITFGILLYRFIYQLENQSRIVLIGLMALLICCVLNTFSLPFAALAGGCGLFMLALSLPIKSSEFTLRLRNQSMWIYYIHMYPIFVYGVVNRGFNPLHCFLFTALAVFLISYTAVKLQEKSAFSWLKKLAR
jgi:hypothetical protein